MDPRQWGFFPSFIPLSQASHSCDNCGYHFATWEAAVSQWLFLSPSVSLLLWGALVPGRQLICRQGEFIQCFASTFKLRTSVNANREKRED